MKYLHVLLDADMTLIDFKAAQRSALITTYEKYGFPVNEESIAFYDELNDDEKEMFFIFHFGFIFNL